MARLERGSFAANLPDDRVRRPAAARQPFIRSLRVAGISWTTTRRVRRVSRTRAANGMARFERSGSPRTRPMTVFVHPARRHRRKAL
jgi:hypothetical protein